MQSSLTDLVKANHIIINFFALFASISLSAQIFDIGNQSGPLSISSEAKIFKAGKQQYTFDEIRQNQNNLPFVPLKNIKENQGFTNHDYWVNFELENPTSKVVDFYFETARPITDVVNLYLVDENGKVTKQYNGDKIPFSKKAVLHRKSVFNIRLLGNEKIKAFLHLKSDGEVVMLPMNLYEKEAFLYLSYKEQLFYGFFYGILFLACIIYGFFYFALKDKAFVYYGLYVLFIALLQFSLDGFFHQYILPQGGLLSDVSVLFFAFTSLFFFGKYGDKFLNLKINSLPLHRANNLIHSVIGLGIMMLFLGEELLKYCYPIANAIGVVVLLHMIVSIGVVKIKGMAVDNYFIVGISFLVLGFVVFILNNFNIVENSFLTDNGAKFGIGLEIVFLSISMSNRIRNLRVENERNQLLALQRSEDMNEIKSSFLSNISHELRTPLNLIMGVATSLQQNEEQENLEEKCKLILSSSNNLLDYIDDILDFTVIEKGTYELKEAPFELRPTLKRLFDAKNKKALEKNLDFKQCSLDHLPNRIIGDKGKLVQILNHLLDNAIKFTNSGEVNVQLNYNMKNNGKAQFDFIIEDTGIGISKEKMSTIYESFTKKSFRDNREFSGLGLGLYIVKTYVDLQGGTININNRAGQGTVCKVSLEFKIDEDVIDEFNTINTIDTVANFKESRILLVEDNKMNQMVIKLLFKKMDTVDLTIANNGKEALEKFVEKEFDLVLMDLQMPVMDGFETISLIRGGKASCSENIPIIVVTADTTNETSKEVYRLGADDIVTKPIKSELLLRKIARIQNSISTSL